MKKAIATLNRLFPKINAVCTTEWDGSKGGIWFRQEGEAHKDGIPYFDYYNDNQQVHPEVEKAFKKLGLYAEPYDAGTWMAYEG